MTGSDRAPLTKNQRALLTKELDGFYFDHNDDWVEFTIKLNRLLRIFRLIFDLPDEMDRYLR